MPAITPGPCWALQERGDSWAIIGQHRRNHRAVTGIVVARVDEPHAEANAKAIAAVPSLLEALNDAAEAMRILAEVAEEVRLEGSESLREREAACRAALRLAGATE